jgi:hypothetical protein
MERSPRIPLPPGEKSAKVYRPELANALSEYQDAVVRLSTIDPVTTELVRLRCARYHDCHT